MTAVASRDAPPARGAPVAATACALAFVGVAAAAGQLVPLVVVVVVVVVVTLSLRTPVFGGALLAASSVTNASSVLQDQFGIPSMTEPMMLLVVVSVVLATRRTGRACQNPTPQVVVLFGIYLAVQIISEFWADDRAAAITTISTTFRDMVIALIVISTVRTVSDQRVIVWSLIASGFVLGLISIHQVATGNYFVDYFGFGQASIEQIVGRVDDWRIKGPLDDPNFYAQLMVVVFALALDRSIAESSRVARSMALLCAIVAALTVVFTFSRGGLVAMATVVVVIALVHRPAPRTVLVGLVLLVGLVAVLPSSYTDRLGQLTTALDPAAGSAVRADPSVTGRSSELQAGLRMFVDHPVVGVGAGNYEARYQEYSRVIGLDPRREDREAHNLFVEVAAETGLLGLAAFGALLVLAAQALFRSARTSDRMGLAGALAAALTGYLVTAIFLHAAYSRTFWILLVLAFASAAQQLHPVARPESAGRGHG